MRSLHSQPPHLSTGTNSRRSSKLKPISEATEDKSGPRQVRTSSSRASDTATRPTRFTATSSRPNQSTTITPSSGSGSRSTARTPLGRGDENVAPMTRTFNTTSRTSRATKMPPEKTNSGRPLQPTLAAAKTVNRSPLTPKIASKAPTSQARQQPVTLATTPLARRTTRPDVSSSTPSVPTPHEGQKEEYASPVSAFLNNNVTPRSGSRQSRVDSANSTPSGTPSGTPSHDRAGSQDRQLGLGISLEADRRPASSPFSPSLSEHEASQRPDTQGTAEAKFFYASDARGAQPAPPKRNPPAQAKASTFFYANGGAVPERPSIISAPASYSPAPGPSQSHDQMPTKLIYSGRNPEQQQPPKQTFGPPRPSSAASTTTKAPPSRPGTSASGTQPRPVSPMKLPSRPSIKSNSLHQSSSPGVRPPLGPSPQLAPQAGRRRVSIEPPSAPKTAVRGGHSRSRSTLAVTLSSPKVTSPQSPREVAASPLSPTREAASPMSPTMPLAGFASILQAVEDLDDQEESQVDGPQDGSRSPAKSPQPNEQLSELVASARRERKVQDLQITNASLEAINRTLEKQLRKQTNELRRYKRLSRAGRLSLPAATPRPTSANESIVQGQAEGLKVSDPSEDEQSSSSDLEEDSDESDLSESDSGSSGLSPSVRAERDARHRTRDEKRLKLDLSKHQQILIDSQKMNQSLKRCLGWTEELIREGKRALEYQVRVSEVEIGGRVLVPADEEDEERDDTLLSTSFHSDEEWDKDPQDRDSGIELPVDGG